MPAVNGHVVGSPALQASMSMLSFEPAASTSSLPASIASAGSFCLFCENGLDGLPTETSRSPAAAVAPGTARTSAAATTPRGQSFPFIRLPFRSKGVASDIYPVGAATQHGTARSPVANSPVTGLLLLCRGKSSARGPGRGASSGCNYRQLLVGAA